MTKTTMKKRLATIFLAVNTLMLIQHTTKAQVSLTTIGTAYTQNFNTYTTATPPAGWSYGGTYRGTSTGSNCSSTQGGQWGFNVGTDYAFGLLHSGTNTNVTLVGNFVNNTGVTVQSLVISFDYRQFGGCNNSGLDLSATGVLAGNATVNGQDFAGVAGAGLGATTTRTFTVTGLSIANGATFGFSWVWTDGAGADNGVAIDNFSITPKVNQPTLNISDVTVVEGNAGTTNALFTVSLTSAAGASGVTFNIATADQTATLADNDYVNTSLTAVTIPSGSSSYTFTVPVNGDLNVEPNETFLVNVSGVTNATAGDVQGVGTITNDDYIPPAVSGNPAGGTYCNGTLVTFTASATGTPTPTVQWQVSTNGGATYANAGGTSATTTTYTFIATPGVNNNMYQAVFTNPGGTATTTAAALIVNPTYSIPQTVSVCRGASYTFPDGTIQTNIIATANHTSHLMSVSGCDSAITTTVNVNPTYNFTETFSICSGTDYTFPDGTTMTGVTTVTTHTSNLATIHGCDSLIVTTLNINPTYNTTDTVWVCNGSDYTFGDGTMETSITSSVTHTSFLFSMQFCDSVATTVVMVNTVYNLSETVAVCSGGNYTFPDGTMQDSIITATTYTSNLTSVYGCDSIIVTTVNVNPIYMIMDTVAVCSGNAYTFPDGMIISGIIMDTTYTSNLSTTAGCDSIIVTTVNVNPVYMTTDTVWVCSGTAYTFPDGTTNTGITMDTTHTSNLSTTAGCDSIIVTRVNVNPTYSTPESVAICSGMDYTFPDGSTQTNITATTVYTSSFLTIHGCDSSIVTTVNVNPVYNINQTVSVCTGSNYTFPDGTSQTNITTATTYTSNLSTVAGCDSIIVTTVNVNSVYNMTETAAVCPGNSYTFPDGTTQTNITSAITYTSNLVAMGGCDSIVVTTVNVNPIDTTSMSQAICMGDSISFFGTFLNTAGTYYHTLTSMAGCDSVISLTLGVNSLPMVSFDYMGGSVTSICAEVEDTLYLNGGMPAGGVYSSPFSSGDTLFPQDLVNTMGGGTYVFGYIYTNGASGCSNIAYDTLAVSYCVGLKENGQQALNVSVYPNPAHDQLTVEFESATAGATITLLNTLGQTVMLKQTDSQTTSLGLLGIKAGIYYLSIESKSTKLIKKIVVE
jgi:hypothetical protein